MHCMLFLIEAVAAIKLAAVNPYPALLLWMLVCVQGGIGEGGPSAASLAWGGCWVGGEGAWG